MPFSLRHFPKLLGEAVRKTYLSILWMRDPTRLSSLKFVGLEELLDGCAAISGIAFVYILSIILALNSNSKIKLSDLAIHLFLITKMGKVYSNAVDSTERL